LAERTILSHFRPGHGSGSTIRDGAHIAEVHHGLSVAGPKELGTSNIQLGGIRDVRAFPEEGGSDRVQFGKIDARAPEDWKCDEFRNPLQRFGLVCNRVFEPQDERIGPV
jgi:hypothetical protein